MTGKEFATLPLGRACLDNLARLEYREMTPIQALALPPMLEGRDVLGCIASAGTATPCGRR